MELARRIDGGRAALRSSSSGALRSAAGALCGEASKRTRSHSLASTRPPSAASVQSSRSSTPGSRASSPSRLSTSRPSSAGLRAAAWPQVSSGPRCSTPTRLPPLRGEGSRPSSRGGRTAAREEAQLASLREAIAACDCRDPCDVARTLFLRPHPGAQPTISLEDFVDKFEKHFRKLVEQLQSMGTVQACCAFRELCKAEEQAPAFLATTPKSTRRIFEKPQRYLLSYTEMTTHLARLGLTQRLEAEALERLAALMQAAAGFLARAMGASQPLAAPGPHEAPYTSDDVAFALAAAAAEELRAALTKLTVKEHGALTHHRWRRIFKQLQGQPLLGARLQFNDAENVWGHKSRGTYLCWLPHDDLPEEQALARGFGRGSLHKRGRCEEESQAPPAASFPRFAQMLVDLASVTKVSPAILLLQFCGTGPLQHKA